MMIRNLFILMSLIWSSFISASPALSSCTECKGLDGFVTPSEISEVMYIMVGKNPKKYKEKAIELNNRAKVLKSIKYVDKVIAFSESTPCSLIKKIKPDIYVKGPDYLNKNIAELKILKELNIEYMVPRVDKILSTSNILI